MSRLDQQIGLVQRRMFLDRFVRGVTWSVVGVLAIAVAVALAGKLFQVWLPHELVFACAGVAVVLVAGIAYAMWKPPTAREAAVAIDNRLSLKEKFSTALYARPLADPFARAAVRDAEKTAESVSMSKRFPLTYSVRGLVLASVAGIALLVACLLPNFDLARVQAKKQQKVEMARREQGKAERAIKQAIVQMESAPKAVAESEPIKLARQDLSEMLKKPLDNPAAAQQKAQKALEEMESVKQKIADQQKYAAAQNEAKALSAMPKADDDKTPIAQAQNAMSKGNFSEAVDDIKSAVENFDKMNQKQKDQTANDMSKLAQQMAQMANDPKVQQQMQQQLQQMGATQQQAQQMQQLMQQAANGNQQAQQQLQQAAKQLAQQMNQKQGGSAQQQQQVAQAVQKAMQQMQQQANSQAQAQQMSQSAQQLAQAMQQSARQASQQAGGKQGQQGQGSKQANAQAGQQGQSQQQQGQGQQGQSAQQQMAQAGQSMQQQLQQMQAMAKDGQAVAAGQQGQGQQPGQGQQQGQGNQPGGNQGGQWAAGNPNNQPGQGFGGPGQANGGRPDPEVAPFGVKTELSQSQVDEKGKILASSFVKAGTVKGESKVGLADAALKAEQDATDEVDEDRIPRSAAKAVKDYFQTIKDDSAK